jgi:uncharacterized protein
MIQAFTNEDFQRLDEWLLRRRTGLLDAVMLEGFLTAIVIGPNTLMPMTWLPKVWGGRQARFKDLEEMNRFMALVMGLHNDIALHFDTDPSGFEPTFYESKVGKKRVLVVDEWCEGFMKGMRIDSAGWKRLGRERPELLRPLRLFGTRAGWRELATGGEGKLHAQWSVRVAPAVREIYAYWLPHRRAQIAPEDREARLH